MYKIVFIVAVFAFALQGSLGSPLADSDNNVGVAVKQPEKVADVQSKAVENKPEDVQTTSTTPSPAVTTEAPKSGASSTEICLLLVQVSSLALVAKHMLL